MAINREHLTPTRIKNLERPDGKHAVYFFDDDPKRLAVRVTPAGAKSFVYCGKLNGTPFRVTIGGIDDWNISDAREEARRLQRMVDRGVDPREQAKEEAEAKARAKEEKAAAKAAKEKARQYTFRALCEEYSILLENKGKNRSAAATRSAFKCHVFTDEAVSNTPANEVTALQIAALIRKVREAGKERAAGILRSYLSAAFNAAKRAPFDAKLPASLIPFEIKNSPIEAIPAIATNRGQRALSAEELKGYLTELGDDLADQALKLALYAGGQRMAQLLRTKVSDYDATTKTLRIWDSKGKRKEPREHLLPLAPVAAKIVQNLISHAKERETERAKTRGDEPAFHNLWLFSSHGRAAMTQETPGKRAAEISKNLKGQPFNLRDIRRTVETMLAQLRTSKDIRAQLLSHGLSGVQTANYDRHDYFREKRAALAKWERHLEEIRTGKKASNVINMRGAA